MEWTAIKTESEYQNAKDRLKEISGTKPEDENYDEFVQLTDLLEMYEQEKNLTSSSHGLIQAIKAQIEKHSQPDNDLGEKKINEVKKKNPPKIIGANEDSAFLGIIK